MQTIKLVELGNSIDDRALESEPFFSFRGDAFLAGEVLLVAVPLERSLGHRSAMLDEKVERFLDGEEVFACLGLSRQVRACRDRRRRAIW